MNEAFRKAAQQVSLWTGTPIAFGLAFLVIVIWAVTGPLFAFSDTWQLVINTGTTIVTFLMVFLIQNTQNRDSRAIHMKLDDLIIYTEGADNELVDMPNLTDAQLDRMERRYQRLAKVLGKDNGVPKDASPSRPSPRRSGSNGQHRVRSRPKR